MVHVDDLPLGFGSLLVLCREAQILARFLSQAKVSFVRRNHFRGLVSRGHFTKICYNTEKAVGGPRDHGVQDPVGQVLC